MSQAPTGYEMDTAGNLIPKPVTKGGRVGKGADMTEMSNEEAAKILYNPMADDGLSVEEMNEAFRKGAAALRRLDELEKWVDKWLAWEPDWNSLPTSTRIIHSYGASQGALKAFKAALNGDMQMPPDTE